MCWWCARSFGTTQSGYSPAMQFCLVTPTNTDMVWTRVQEIYDFGVFHIFSMNEENGGNGFDMI